MNRGHSPPRAPIQLGLIDPVRTPRSCAVPKDPGVLGVETEQMLRQYPEAVDQETGDLLRLINGPLILPLLFLGGDTSSIGFELPDRSHHREHGPGGCAVILIVYLMADL
jgi:hypothetical protein